MKVYLSARFGRKEEMYWLAMRMSSDLGHEITSSWIMLNEDVDDPQLAERDLDEVRECDVMVHFSEEPGTPGAARGGRLVELGMAAALGKRLIIVGPSPENIFHRLPGVVHFDSINGALLYLEMKQEG